MIITLSNLVGVQILISGFKLTSLFGLLSVTVKSQLKQSAMNNNKINHMKNNDIAKHVVTHPNQVP